MPDAVPGLQKADTISNPIPNKHGLSTTNNTIGIVTLCPKIIRTDIVSICVQIVNSFEFWDSVPKINRLTEIRAAIARRCPINIVIMRI